MIFCEGSAVKILDCPLLLVERTQQRADATQGIAWDQGG